MSKISFAVILTLLVMALPAAAAAPATPAAPAPQRDGLVAVMDMDMLILPGTEAYLAEGIERAEREGAKLLVVKLNTPGGMLPTAQKMIQLLFQSPVPVAVYVSQAGASATSAGVFITLAAHVAAMAPGTSIGAAHPVTGEGKDIEGDMRAKAENMTIAMVKSIAEQRGRNVGWAEQSVKESSSITEQEALKMSVVDLVADDMNDLLRQIKGKRVKVGQTVVTLGDYTAMPRHEYRISLKDKTLNFFANPNVVALLWLAATTGLSLELYHPGAILPGVVGVICLILALAVSQIIPVSQGGLLLLIVGALLIGAEFYVPSGILGVGGVIAMVLGALYLIDVSQAPGLSVELRLILPVAVLLGGFLLFAVTAVVRTHRRRATTGFEGLIGTRGRALEDFSAEGKVFVQGEIWTARTNDGLIVKDEEVLVVGQASGLVLDVRKVAKNE